MKAPGLLWGGSAGRVWHTRVIPLTVSRSTIAQELSHYHGTAFYPAYGARG